MDDDRPPFLKSWRAIYLSVVIYSCVLVLLLYWVTVALNR